MYLKKKIGQIDLKRGTKVPFMEKYSFRLFVCFVIDKLYQETEHWGGRKLLFTVTILDAGKMKKQ